MQVEDDELESGVGGATSSEEHDDEELFLPIAIEGAAAEDEQSALLVHGASGRLPTSSLTS